jgi:ribosomal protein S18 acetylase RimI-like enzyme
MPLTVRRGTIDDLEVIVEFNQRLAQGTEDKSLEPAVIRGGVAAALLDPQKGPYFLAVDGDEIVGQLQITYEFSDWRNGWFWWIQGVYVQAAARRRGVFRTLYEHVCEAARRDPEVIGIRLYVEKENHRAQDTYRGMGMKETDYLMFERCPV